MDLDPIDIARHIATGASSREESRGTQTVSPPPLAPPLKAPERRSPLAQPLVST